MYVWEVLGVCTTAARRDAAMGALRRIPANGRRCGGRGLGGVLSAMQRAALYNGGGNRAYLFTVDGPDGRFGWFFIKPAQYMDKWRLDRTGVRPVANTEVKKALGFN